MERREPGALVDGGPQKSRRDQQTRQHDVSRSTQKEHDALLQAMHCLEAALASPAPTRERRWAARARKDLELVRGLLQAHVLSAEGPGGLFEELDITRPTVAHRVAELRQEHSHLLLLANDLCHSLDPSPALPDFSALRHQAARFLTALRHHHAAEVDLLLECFWTDIGVGD